MRTVAAVLFAVLSIAASSPAAVRYVSAAATGANDGSSWVDASVYLQDALGAATAGDTLWVASGTYYPDEGAGQTPDNRASTFTIPDGVAVLGGFAVGETAVGQRNWVDNVTTLSGAIDGNADTAGNAWHVVTLNEVGEQTVLDGLTISGGNANGSSYWEYFGGGVLCYSEGAGKRCDPRIANCVFTANSGRYGGGLALQCNTSAVGAPTLSNCRFEGNSAEHGGGLLIRNNSGTGSPILTDCTIIGNTAQVGGGMHNYTHGGTSNALLTRCIINSNTAGNIGGGLYNNGHNGGVSNPSLTDCTISGNSAGSGGGVHSMGFNGTGSPSFTNCIISGNRANYGGGIEARADNGTCNPCLINCTITANRAVSSGHGMRNDGTNGTCSPTLVNCILSDNGGDFAEQLVNNGASVLDTDRQRHGSSLGKRWGARRRRGRGQRELHHNRGGGGSGARGAGRGRGIHAATVRLPGRAAGITQPRPPRRLDVFSGAGGATDGNLDDLQRRGHRALPA